MDHNQHEPALRLADRLAAAARTEQAPGVDVCAGVLATVRGRRVRPVAAWDWSFAAVALASCAVALVAMAVSADAFDHLFDPLVAMMSVYPDIQF